MPFSTLRGLDRARCQQLNAIARLTQAGFNARLAEVDSNKRYLRFRVEAAAQGFDALIALDSWFACQFPALADLAWVAADDATVLDLANAASPALEWQHGWLADARVRALDICTGAGTMISLSTRQGEVLCQALPDAVWPESLSSDWVNQLPLRLQLRLGRQTLEPSLFSKIEIDDVLMLQQPHPQLVCHGHTLFNFSIQQENIMLEPALNAEDATAAAALPLSSGQIPLTVEFVLQELTLSVAEIGQLSPGQVLSLSPDAERKVALRANGVLLARGELVEVNQQLGVQITQLLLGA